MAAISTTAATAVVITHRGVEITYDEEANKWRFELRGRERSAESLANAKKAIDAPSPKDKTKVAAARFQAYQLERYGFDGSKVTTVTVTSMAESARYGRDPDFWVTSSRGGREKVSRSELLKVNTANDALLETLKQLYVEKAELSERIERTKQALERIDVPTPEEA